MPLFTIEDSYKSVPAGNYQATFTGMKPVETAHGKAFRWTFKTDDGKEISAISDGVAPPTVGNRTGKWLCALATKPLQAGVQIDPDHYIGKRYFVIVSAAPENRTKLDTFSALSA